MRGQKAPGKLCFLSPKKEGYLTQIWVETMYQNVFPKLHQIYENVYLDVQKTLEMDTLTHIQTMFWKSETHSYTEIAEKYTHLGGTSPLPKYT